MDNPLNPLSQGDLESRNPLNPLSQGDLNCSPLSKGAGGIEGVEGIEDTGGLRSGK